MFLKHFFDFLIWVVVFPLSLSGVVRGGHNRTLKNGANMQGTPPFQGTDRQTNCYLTSRRWEVLQTLDTRWFTGGEIWPTLSASLLSSSCFWLTVIWFWLHTHSFGQFRKPSCPVTWCCFTWQSILFTLFETVLLLVSPHFSCCFVHVIHHVFFTHSFVLLQQTSPMKLSMLLRWYFCVCMVY